MTTHSLRNVLLGAALAATLPAQTQFVDFAPRGHLPRITVTTEDVALVDVDGDGDLDALLATLAGPGLYTNDGRGRFARSRIGSLPLRNDPSTALDVADVDGDGFVDALFGAGAAGDLLYLGNGAGGFTDASSRLPVWPTPSTDVLLADVDGDGDRDIVRGGLLGGLQLAVNDGTGRFRDATAQLPTPPASALTQALALGDIDGDGDPDLVWATGQFAQFTQVYANDGRGVFTDVTATAIPGQAATNARALHLGDLDGDGDADLLVGAIPTNQLYRNDGRGVFADVAATHLPTDRWFESQFAAADFDEDGDVDVLVATAIGFNPDANVFWLNTGGGVFVDATSARLTATPRPSASASAGDVDGDGDLDVFVGNGSGPLTAVDELYLNLHRHIETAVPPAVGGSFGLELVHAPGYGSAPRLALPGLAFALAPVPHAVPFGTLFLAPEVIALPWVAVFPLAPTRVTVHVPARPALRGTGVFVQALFIDLLGGVRPVLTGYTADTIR